MWRPALSLYQAESWSRWFQLWACRWAPPRWKAVACCRPCTSCWKPLWSSSTCRGVAISSGWAPCPSSPVCSSPISDRPGRLVSQRLLFRSLCSSLWSTSVEPGCRSSRPSRLPLWCLRWHLGEGQPLTDHLNNFKINFIERKKNRMKIKCIHERIFIILQILC